MDYNKMADEQLIAHLHTGDNKIIDFLMEKYKGMVRQKARAMYLYGGENDDLIQEGMIGLFKAIRDYDLESDMSFRSFADMCVTRQMYSAIRASQRKKHMPLNSYISIYETRMENPDGMQLTLADTIAAGAESNPEELLLGEEYAQSFEEELKSRLSKFENRVFCLHLLGMDYVQIAEVVDKSPKAVDNALQRMKSKAKALMEEKLR